MAKIEEVKEKGQDLAAAAQAGYQEMKQTGQELLENGREYAGRQLSSLESCVKNKPIASFLAAMGAGILLHKVVRG